MDVSAVEGVGDLLGNGKAEEHVGEEEASDERSFEEEKRVFSHHNHEHPNCNFRIRKEKYQELSETDWSQHSQEEHHKERPLAELDTEESLLTHPEKQEEHQIAKQVEKGVSEEIGELVLEQRDPRLVEN